jgi:hypothetical protein
MTVEKSQASTRCAGQLGSAKEVGALEAGGSMDVTLTVLRQNNLRNQSREPLLTTTRIPNREAQILLAIGPQKMLPQSAMNLG